MKPDLKQAREHLALLDPSPGARWGFRTFADGGDNPRLAIKCCGTLDRGVRQSANPAKNNQPCQPGSLLSFMNDLGAGVFFTPNTLDGRGQTAANVVGVRALFVDADSRPEVDRLHAFIAATGLAPTVTVASGGLHDGAPKLQAYWRVEGCSVANFETAQRLLISRVGSDPSVYDRARVMRLPGFWHRKREPRQSRVVSISKESVFTFGMFIAEVERQPMVVALAPVGRARTGTIITTRTTGIAAGPTARLRELMRQNGGLIVPAVRALLAEAVGPGDGPGTRHATLVAAVARLARNGWEDSEIRIFILPIIDQAWGEGSWSEHIDRIFSWVRGRELAHGVVLGWGGA